MNIKGILIAVSLVIASFALGQSGGKSTGQGKTIKIGGRQIQRQTAEEKVERLAKAVNLTADQKKKVLAVYKASAAKRKAAFEDKKLDFGQKRTAFEQIGSDTDAQLKTILTKDQVRKLEGLRKQRGRR